MINFIICEDSAHVRELDEKIIAKIAMPYDFDYKVFSFEKYNSKLKSIIETSSDFKIYILDIELPNKSGIDIAREIRNVDWDSIIVILTSHSEVEMQVLKEKLLILDFISKFEDYEKRLSDTISLIIKKIGIRKVLSFKSNKELHHISYDNILYIYRDKENCKTKIVTNDSEYIVNESISSLILRLDARFYQTHRACYVNKEKVKTIDFKSGVIFFENDKSIDYLSRSCKKGLKTYGN